MIPKIPLKVLYTFCAIFAVLIFVIDVFMFVVKNDNISIVAISVGGFQELLILLLAAGWALIIRQILPRDQLDLLQKLRQLAIFLTINYVVYFLLRLIIDPQYAEDGSGRYINFDAVIFSNAIGLTAILTLIPIIFLIRELIFYKQRRTTQLYFKLFVGLILISSIYVYFTDAPLPWDFTEDDIRGSILTISLIIVSLLLAFRNDWITYLPRKQKIFYFVLGIVVFAQITLLQDSVYKFTLPPFSYTIANFATIIWMFMLLYGGFVMVTLLVHLPTARAVDRKLMEVQSLYNFARTLNSERNYQKLTQLITQLTSQVLESQSTWFEEYSGETDTLKVISHINLTQQQILDNPLNSVAGFNRAIILEKKPVLINDISQHPSLRDITKWKKDARALIAAPLYSNRDQLMGIIYATKPQPYSFDTDDVSLLEGFANQSAIAMENVFLWKSSIERERLEQELQVAREVQLKLVPQTMPEIKGMDLDTYFLTAYEVGGDYYDFIEFEDNMPGVVIGDVSGKGTSAAFYMAEFKGVIQTLARTTNDPKELISQANRVFYSNTERQSFITAIVGKYNPANRKFSFVRAGHNPVLHCCGKDGKTKYYQPSGLGIGLDSGTIFEDMINIETIDMAAGDTLLLYTDGLIEARDASNDEFGDDRLLSLVSNCNGASAAETKESILRSVMDFIGNTPLHDDLTLIVLKCQ